MLTTQLTSIICKPISLFQRLLKIWMWSMNVLHNSNPNSAVLKLTFTSLGPCFCLPGRSSIFHQENNSLDIGQVDVGKKVGQNVPPGVFWRSQLRLEQQCFLKFNISVQKNALIGVYGRKGLAPTHTQVKPVWKPNQKIAAFLQIEYLFIKKNTWIKINRCCSSVLKCIVFTWLWFAYCTTISAHPV